MPRPRRRPPVTSYPQGRYLRVMGEEVDDAHLDTTSLGTSGAGGARGAGGDSFEEDPSDPAFKLQLQACESGGSDAAAAVHGGDAPHPGGMINEAESKTMFVTDADGSGIGDQAEVVQFVSADRRQDKVSATNEEGGCEGRREH